MRISDWSSDVCSSDLVGPASAGSDPGPICYGRGGLLPTITDALLMLGILSADAGFAGGSFSLTTEGVREAFEKIATQMGCSVEDAAFDCWRVVNARSEEHTSELQSLMRISYAVFCLKKKKVSNNIQITHT